MTGTKVNGSRNATRSGSHQDRAALGTRFWPRLRASVLSLVCALALSALIGGCTDAPIALPSQSSPAVQQAQRLAAAKNALAPAMADVEACELAVLRGTSVDELSHLAARARASTSAFAATENSKLIPNSTQAVLLASRYYSDSCGAWRAQIKADQAAMFRGMRSNGAVALLGPMRTERHYILWVEAALNLGKARTALKDGPP